MEHQKGTSENISTFSCHAKKLQFNQAIYNVYNQELQSKDVS